MATIFSTNCFPHFLQTFLLFYFHHFLFISLLLFIGVCDCGSTLIPSSNFQQSFNISSNLTILKSVNQSQVFNKSSFNYSGGLRDIIKKDENNSIFLNKKSKRSTKSGVARSKDGRRILTVLGLFDLGLNNYSIVRKSGDGDSEREAAEMALEDVNKDRKILPGYQLVMHTNDTQCDAGTGVDAFFHSLYSKQNASTKIISLLGTACSEVTERIAKVATHQGIVQVSFGSTSPSLSDRKEFPLFYRTVAPVSSHSQAIIELITHFKWDTVSFFTENENRFTMPANYLVKELEEKGNISCKTSLTFSKSDLKEQLEELKARDSRIIIASFGTHIAPLVFCEAHTLEMFGPDFAWIWIGKSETNWWSPLPPPVTTPFHIRTRLLRNNLLKQIITTRESNTNYKSGESRRRKRKSGYYTGIKVNTNTNSPPINTTCTPQQLTEAIENSLVVDRFNVLDFEKVSEFGLTTESFTERLKARLKKKGGPLSISQYAPEAYDGVWTIALGLEKIRKKYNYSLENFNYMDDYFSRVFNEEIGKLKFSGISGPITFSGSDRIGITSFMQVQGGKLNQIGLFYPDHEDNKLDLRDCPKESGLSLCHSIQWPGNQVPIARREFRIKLLRVENSLYIFIASLSSLGILLAAMFLAFNLYYRKLKYIKLSSPRLNNLLIVGCIFAYVAVIILGSDFSPDSTTDSNGQRFSYICTIRAYLLSSAFSLAFGSMFAKTYRVHRIFTRSCIGVVKNKLLKDTQLMTLIMALLLIDVIIVTSWAVVDPMHRHLRNLTIQIDNLDRSVVLQPQIEVCSSQRGEVWLGIMYGYKSLLLVVGIYMAWETRHVKIQALNDSKNIAYCVYIVVLTSVLAVTLANLISERVTLSFVSVTSLILTSTTVTLCLLFLPKIHAIKTGGHKGDPVLESTGLKIEFNTRRLVVEDPKELLFRAEVQNRVYKRQIEAIDVEIWRLENLLCSNHSSIASLENLRKLSKDTRHSKESGGDQSDDDSSSSEIYTVYLHGPRFIVPISILNFQNPNVLLPQITSTTLHPPAPLPRSSWPNMRSLLSPSNGLINKIRFKSEPRLLIEEGQSLQSHRPSVPTLLSPRVTFGSSDDSFTLEGQSSKASGGGGKSSRKSSSTSVTPGASKRSSGSNFLSMLKQPFAYFSGKVRSGARSSSPPFSRKKGSRAEGDPTSFYDGCDCEDAPEVFHLHVPKDPYRHKFNSVPDLWAVRTSPLLMSANKKSSIMSDSVVDTSRFADCSRYGLSTSNPVLKLTVTSDESPYL